MHSKWNVLGLMSGTSLDGLDMAYCQFSIIDNKWKYSLLDTQFIPYSEALKERILKAYSASGRFLTELDHTLGIWYGKAVADALLQNNWEPQLIASHGQTIFHEPEKGYTLQIGNPMDIHYRCKIPVVADLRSWDVLLGGQGAPLVPIGDRLLFATYNYRLNIGGFANISYEKDNTTYAFDICGTNIVMNKLTQLLGKSYDDNGNLGRKGQCNAELLHTLNNLDFYKITPPKSLGYEWIESTVWPILSSSSVAVIDQLTTYYHHIAEQISVAIRNVHKPSGKMLITGGGAHNGFLVELLKNKLQPVEIIIPDKATIDYKEAIIFAFLGLLRWRGEVNTLKSVTGAKSDSSGGIIINNLQP